MNPTIFGVVGPGFHRFLHYGYNIRNNMGSYLGFYNYTPFEEPLELHALFPVSSAPTP